jgi:hypothetical protein
MSRGFEILETRLLDEENQNHKRKRNGFIEKLNFVIEQFQTCFLYRSN